MARCPKYLKVDDFDLLASSLGYTLSDDGVSALGEITEYLATQLILVAASKNGKHPLNFEDITKAASRIGIRLTLASNQPKVENAKI